MGNRSNSKAAAPAMCGAAKEVPLTKAKPPPTWVVRKFWPGADR